MIRNKLLLISLCFLMGLTIGCESEEDDLLKQAQNCLNNNIDYPAGLTKCKTYLKGMNSAEARQLGCSIEFGLAGLTNARMVKAFEVLEEDGATANKEAKFMTLFSLDSVPAANLLAETCTGTDSEGLEFLADASRMGTVLADQLGLAGTIDENTDTDSLDVPQMLTNCEGDPVCKEAIGTSADSMYQIYCIDADVSDNEVCADVNAAIAAGGDPVDVGQTLIDLLQ